MTEAEWLTAEKCDDAMCSTALDSPGWLFRKQTLFSIACFQRVLAVLPDDRAASLLAEFEAAALTPTMDTSVDFTRPLSDYALGELYVLDGVASQQFLFALVAVARGYISQVAETCSSAIVGAKNEQSENPDREENLAQAAILRDIVGNPFRPVTFSPEWRTDTAVTLARQIYESRDFSAMPILADALQDAGCDSDDILSHCRDPKQVHVRGCWVVDLVIGKE